MSSSTRTALIAALSVVLAVALIFAGAILGAAVPQVDKAAQTLLGKDSTNENQGDGTGSQVDTDLQNEILQKLEDTYYKAIDAEALSASAVEGMLASLDDPYTVYYTPQEYQDLIEQTSGSYSGVGMVLMMNGPVPTVVSVFEGSPAADAGIESGDIIMSVDGSTTSGRTLDEVVGDIKGVESTKVELVMYRPATPATTTSTTVAESQVDVESTESTTTEDISATLIIDLTGLPQGGVSKSYTMTRRSIAIPTTETTILDEGGKKVAYIVLYTFANENAGEQLRNEVESVMADDQVDAIILDLRDNGGGLLDEAIKVASIFINNGVIVSTKGLHYPEETESAAGDAVSDIPLYLLTNKYSASASEIVAGALQDYGRATLVGETTFGKGLVQQIEPLSNGGAVKVTIEVYLTPKGRDINKTGIAPDVVAPDDPATQDVDETVEKALDLISAAK
jgi:carboxyl-terminal processing protease